MIFMTQLINVRSNVKVVVVGKSGFSLFSSYMYIESA